MRRQDKNLTMEVRSDCVNILYNGNIYPLYTFSQYDTYIKKYKHLSFEEVIRKLLLDDVFTYTTRKSMLEYDVRIETRFEYDVRCSVKELVYDAILKKNNHNQLFYSYVCDCVLKAMLEYIKLKLNGYKN